MKVVKFSGVALDNPTHFSRIKDIILKSEKEIVVVVSALKGVTDQLVEICENALLNQGSWVESVENLKQFHLQIVSNVNELTKKSELIQSIEESFLAIEKLVLIIERKENIDKAILDEVISQGEIIASKMVYHLLDNAIYIDTQKLIVTESHLGIAKVDFETTEKNLKSSLDINKGPVVVPGFIACNPKGEITTLGRGGSDFTASLIATALNVEFMEIWTNKEGFMTADPAIVMKAHQIEKLTYAEAIELSHFGTRVVLTQAIHQLFKKNIPLYIKNINQPESKGTLISNVLESSGLIKGISSIPEVNLITIQGTSMIGVPGTSKRVFGSLASANINVILITQASSEYSITFAVKPDDSQKALKVLNDEFINEINESREMNILIQPDTSIVAIVGENMRNVPGVSATLFQAFYHNGINAIATAQGSSELNISVVVRKAQLNKALNALHEGFFLLGYRVLNVFLIGTGIVGGALLRQIQNQQEKLLETKGLRINVTGIANIDGILTNSDGIELSNWESQMNQIGEKKDISSFITKILNMNLINSVLVDCTAHPEPASHYLELLSHYISVVTPNKIACSSTYAHYRLLKETAHAKGVKFLYETNVGAGLPIINTLNDLVMSGDKIIQIEAVLSGTLNFIFNLISEEIPLSKTIRLAKEKGYSEPDPRIDLSGTDVVRKILILARESGYELEKEDVKVNTFLPSDCFEGTLDDFWTKVELHDQDFEDRRKKIHNEGKRWRFVARLLNGEASVQLVEVDQNHPAYILEGSNNIIILTTERYKELPMVIKGYGAGADVTAAGVFADIIRVANVY